MERPRLPDRASRRAGGLASLRLERAARRPLCAHAADGPAVAAGGGGNAGGAAPARPGDPLALDRRGAGDRLRGTLDGGGAFCFRIPGGFPERPLAALRLPPLGRALLPLEPVVPARDAGLPAARRRPPSWPA